MKKTLFFITVIGAVLLASCSGGRKGSAADGGIAPDSVRYATGFKLTSHENFKILDIINPWNRTQLLQRYILVDRNAPLPEGLPDGTVIRTPIRNAIVYTTVHASMLEQVGALDAVAGICETEYVTSKAAKERIAQGRISDCGKATSPNVEKIIDLGGEIIIASPFENSSYGQAEKIGIPIFESADYMENDPLGRMEWVRLYGILAGKEKTADSLFNAAADHYNRLKDMASGAERKPRLMVERKYGSSWFVPCGGSYMARMYRDAGADYIFGKEDEAGSVPLSFETVLDQAIDADLWLFKYAKDNGSMTYADLKSEYEPYARFRPFAQKKIYACNTLAKSYYEYIVLHPDYILEDLVYIFHPELLPGHRLRLFEPLAE